MSAPFSLSLGYTRLIRSIALAAHLVPLACVLGAGSSLVVVCGVAGCAAMSAVLTVRRARLLASRFLTVVPRGVSVLGWQGAAPVEVDVQPESVDLGWLIVLVFEERATGRKWRVALTREAAPDGAWHALRRHLRWGLPGEAQSL